MAVEFKHYVTRNQPGHFDSGGTVVIPFATDDEMNAILVALRPSPSSDERVTAKLRHECARNGPCSANGDGCVCSDEELNARPGDERVDLRDSVIEECAKVCDRISAIFEKDDHRRESNGAGTAAEAIRSLQSHKAEPAA